MTSFILKCIAIFTMLIDHLGDAYFAKTTYMNLIGRIAFPIFAFQISEGYIHTKNLKKYFFRLFLFALISQIPFMLFYSIFSTGFKFNVFGTLFLGLLSIFLCDKILGTESKIFFSSTSQNSKSKEDFCLRLQNLICFIPPITLGFIAKVCKFDYGFFGVIIIFLFYLFKNNKIGMIVSFIIACLIKYVINIILYGYHYMYLLLALFTMLSIVFICLYNGKQGKKIKYLLYFFYPVHLLILYFIFR